MNAHEFAKLVGIDAEVVDQLQQVVQEMTPEKRAELKSLIESRAPDIASLAEALTQTADAQASQPRRE